MRRFLRNLKGLGGWCRGRGHRRLEPLPDDLAELLPDARHHLLRLPCPEGTPQARPRRRLRRLRRGLSRRGNRGPQAEAGARPKGQAERRGLTNKEKSAFVFKHRWLIVKRRDRMSDQERADLATMLSYLPELKTLRDFVDRLGMLFEEGQSEALAWGRHAALVSDRSVPGGARVGQGDRGSWGGEVRQDGRLPGEPGGPAGADEQPRGAGQPQARYEEKARYKWRKRRTTVRFLVLLLDRSWRHERAIRNRWQEESQPTVRDRSSPKAATVERVA